MAAILILSGQYVNFRMKKRISSLNQCIVFIENINTQISYSKKNIFGIISELSYSDNMKLKTVYELKSHPNSDLNESWKNVFSEYGKQDYLTRDDIEILLSFGEILGITDLHGQSNNCRLHIEMLKKQLQSAEKDFADKSKINTALSSLLAAATIIIFC